MSIVELITVIAIIGIMIGLLLPAVQAAREAARRLRCKNNLKQIGVALHSYLSVHNVFPAAGRGANQRFQSPPRLEIKGSNGLVSILPFLEQNAIYETMNLRECFTNFTGSPQYQSFNGFLVGDAALNGNAKASEHIIPLFLCPSDISGIRDEDSKQLTGPIYGPAVGFTASKTNYDFVTDASLMSYNFRWSQESRGSLPSRRMFGWESDCKPRDVIDGLSNTFMVGETTRWHINGRAFAWAYRAWVMCGVDPATIDSEVFGGINVWSQPWIWPGDKPVYGRVRSWWCPAASLHPGGAHFAMGDGAVRFIEENVDFQLLNNLTRIADRQVLQQP